MQPVIELPMIAAAGVRQRWAILPYRTTPGSAQAKVGTGDTAIGPSRAERRASGKRPTTYAAGTGINGTGLRIIREKSLRSIRPRRKSRLRCIART